MAKHPGMSEADKPQQALTLANKITVCRILILPVFVWLAATYGGSLRDGTPEESWRIASALVFLLAALSDAADGLVARFLDQRTRLGSILDPIADKALLVSAILTLAISWPDAFPLWFPVLAVGRDLLAVTLVLLINHITRNVEIVPHWSGKCATFFQMAVCAWVLLRLPSPVLTPLLAAAGVFTFCSGIYYLAEGIRYLARHEERE